MRRIVQEAGELQLSKNGVLLYVCRRTAPTPFLNRCDSILIALKNRPSASFIMPRRELKSGKQVADWLFALDLKLEAPGKMTLIGSAALLWHANDRGLTEELPEASMDVDPVTDSDEVALLCYDALIGSEFERTHGWHVNLMPESALQGLPSGWPERATQKQFAKLTLIVPAPADLLVPKLKRNEPRDRSHAEWARRIGLLG